MAETRQAPAHPVRPRPSSGAPWQARPLTTPSITHHTSTTPPVQPLGEPPGLELTRPRRHQISSRSLAATRRPAEARSRRRSPSARSPAGPGPRPSRRLGSGPSRGWPQPRPARGAGPPGRPLAVQPQPGRQGPTARPGGGPAGRPGQAPGAAGPRAPGGLAAGPGHRLDGGQGAHGQPRHRAGPGLLPTDRQGRLRPHPLGAGPERQAQRQGLSEPWRAEERAIPWATVVAEEPRSVAPRRGPTHSCG